MLCEQCERRICAICGLTLSTRKWHWRQTYYRGAVQDVHPVCKRLVRDTTPIPGWLVPIYQEGWAT